MSTRLIVRRCCWGRAIGVETDGIDSWSKLSVRQLRPIRWNAFSLVFSEANQDYDAFGPELTLLGVTLTLRWFLRRER